MSFKTKIQKTKRIQILMKLSVKKIRSRTLKIKLRKLIK